MGAERSLSCSQNCIIGSCVTWLQWKSIYINDLISILMLSNYASLSELFPAYFQIKILYAFLIPQDWNIKIPKNDEASHKE